MAGQESVVPIIAEGCEFKVKSYLEIVMNAQYQQTAIFYQLVIKAWRRNQEVASFKMVCWSR